MSLPGVVVTNQSRAEGVLEDALVAQGWAGWEHSPRDVVGKPDLCLRERDPPVAVFLDGCFWHGCPQHYKEPRKRRLWWRRKITRNRIRDRGVGSRCRRCGEPSGLLVEQGWVVVRVWEHEVEEDVAGTASRVITEILRQSAGGALR